MSALVATILTIALAGAPRPIAMSVAGNLHPGTGTHTYVFSSREQGVPASRFRYLCALDRATLHACPRRLTLRLTAGRHLLRVQAVDPAGRRSSVTRVTIVVRQPVPELRVQQAWQIDSFRREAGDMLFAVAAGPDANIYVADAANNRVVVLDAGGKQLRSWGSPGDGPGQFHFEKATDEPSTAAISSIEVDQRSGAVYVAEPQRVQKFDPQGRFELGWGTSGVGNGQFYRIWDLAVDAAGAVYTLEDRPKTAGRVQKFDTAGGFLTTFGRGQIADAGGIAVDPAGNVFVTDDQADVIDVFGPDGRLLRKLGEPGDLAGQLHFPNGLALARGMLYVADTDHARIVVFDLATGKPTGYWRVTGRPFNVTADASGAVYVFSQTGILTKYQES